MPTKETRRRAAKDKRQGKAPSTQAGEYVKEEIEHVREGKHGVKSPKQAIAIGLSKARRSGVKVPRPKRAATKKRASAKRNASTTTASKKRRPPKKRAPAAPKRGAESATRRRKKSATPRRRTKRAATSKST